MKNRILQTVIFVSVVLTLATLVYAASGRKRGLIRNHNCKDGRLVVDGAMFKETDDGKREGCRGYLGCTMYIDGKTFDFEAIDVERNFNEFFGCEGAHHGSYIVSLWGKKVVGCGCSYCKKHGYHLENRLAKAEGVLR